MIRFEAHNLANRLLGRTDLPRVVETRQLWDENPAAEAVPEDEDVVEPGREEDMMERGPGSEEPPC